MPNLINLDIQKMKESLTQHHKQYDFPVKDITAENILVKFFEGNNYKVLWEQGSHRQGSDVFIIDDKSYGYSVKSAKQPKNGQWLKISSYRTGKYDKLEDKKTVIRKIEEETQGYVIFARTEQKEKENNIVNYYVYLIDPKVLEIDSFNIESSKDGNYEGTNQYNVKIFIKKKMSDQVWYSIPMSLIEEGVLIEKILEVGPFEMKLRNNIKEIVNENKSQPCVS